MDKMNGAAGAVQRMQRKIFPGFNFFKEYIIKVFEEKGKAAARILIKINTKNRGGKFQC
jgi:hypothetical protein